MFKQGPYDPIRTNVPCRDFNPDSFLNGDFDLSVRTVNKEMLDYIEYHINELQKQKCEIHYSNAYHDNRCKKNNSKK